jgi:glycosyltransferase involved in cell wall biosynthesis
MKVAQFPDYRKDNPYQQLLANALAKLGVEVSFPQGYRRGLPFSRALTGAYRVDVLHLHWLTPYLKGKSYPTKAAYALKLLLDLRLAKARGVRLVWTIHNLVSHETTTPKLEIWLSRRLAALADGLIVHSEGAMAAVTKQFKVCAEKIAIIPHGDFADAYGKKMPRAEARQRLGLDQQIPVFLFFGMIRPYKGVESLLKVWKQTYLLHQRGVLIIAGDARDPVLAQSVSLAAADIPNVHLHMRFIPDDEVPVFFSAADYAVFPFTKSLTSGSFALARTYSVPVVAAKTEGAVADGANAGSFFFELNNTHALVSAMKSALEFFSSCQSAPRDAPSDCKWDWTRIACLHQEVYRDRHPNTSLT